MKNKTNMKNKTFKQYNLRISMLLMVMLLMVACGNETNSNKKTAQKKDSNSEIVQVKNSYESLIFENENVTLLVNHYLALKNALVAENYDDSKSWLMKIIEIKDKDKLFVNLKDTLDKMSKTSDINAMRNLFNKLSEGVYGIAKKSKLKSGNLYQQYCPMALEHKGAIWLSTVKEISNPYFGKKMLRCGETQDTI